MMGEDYSKACSVPYCTPGRHKTEKRVPTALLPCFGRPCTPLKNYTYFYKIHA